MSQHLKRLVTLAMLVVVVISLFYGGYVPYDRYVLKQIEAFNAIEVDAPTHFGYIVPMVVDGFSEEPLQNALVVIPETGQHFFTGEDGTTASIRIPILEDPRFSEIVPQPWGEATLIVYKEGYIEYVLLNAHIWENQTRKGPKILLFPEEAGSPSEPFAIMEGPHRMWVNELVKKYRP